MPRQDAIKHIYVPLSDYGNIISNLIIVILIPSIVGYEPADLTVHPPPKTIEGGFIFFA